MIKETNYICNTVAKKNYETANAIQNHKKNYETANAIQNNEKNDIINRLREESCRTIAQFFGDTSEPILKKLYNIFNGGNPIEIFRSQKSIFYNYTKASPEECEVSDMWGKILKCFQ